MKKKTKKKLAHIGLNVTYTLHFITGLYLILGVEKNWKASQETEENRVGDEVVRARMVYVCIFKRRVSLLYSLSGFSTLDECAGKQSEIRLELRNPESEGGKSEKREKKRINELQTHPRLRRLREQRGGGRAHDDGMES